MEGQLVVNRDTEAMEFFLPKNARKTGENQDGNGKNEERKRKPIKFQSFQSIKCNYFGQENTDLQGIFSCSSSSFFFLFNAWKIEDFLVDGSVNIHQEINFPRCAFSFSLKNTGVFWAKVEKCTKKFFGNKIGNSILLAASQFFFAGVHKFLHNINNNNWNG